MLYSCTHMATVGVKGLSSSEWSNDLQLDAVVKVVGARTSLERTESDAGATERYNVTEVIATCGCRLVVRWYGPSCRHAVRLATRRAVELIRRPVARCLVRSSINGKTLRTTRVKLQTDVRNLERLPFQQQENDRHIRQRSMLSMTFMFKIFALLMRQTVYLWDQGPVNVGKHAALFEIIGLFSSAFDHASLKNKYQ